MSSTMLQADTLPLNIMDVGGAVEDTAAATSEEPASHVAVKEGKIKKLKQQVFEALCSKHNKLP